MGKKWIKIKKQQAGAKREIVSSASTLQRGFINQIEKSRLVLGADVFCGVSPLWAAAARQSIWIDFRVYTKVKGASRGYARKYSGGPFGVKSQDITYFDIQVGRAMPKGLRY